MFSTLNFACQPGGVDLFLPTLSVVTSRTAPLCLLQDLKQMGIHGYVDQSCPHEIGIKPQFVIKLYLVGPLFLEWENSWGEAANVRGLHQGGQRAGDGHH